MAKLIQLFWEICLLRAGPQDLPASHILLGMTLIAYAIAGALVAHSLVPDIAMAILASLVDTFLLALLSRGLLWARMLGNRWNQTCTALAGTGCFFELIMWPFNLLQQQDWSTQPTFGLPMIIILVLLIWNVAVIANVLRHALSTTLFNGAILAMVYTYVSISMFRGLFITPHSL